MLVMVDTTPLFGLMNRADHWHKTARIDYDQLVNTEAEFLVPRIVRIEAIGLMTRALARTEKSQRRRIAAHLIDNMSAMESKLVEHTDDDYAEAERLWRQYADWPIEFPDTLILSTARQQQIRKIWTYDKTFRRLISRVNPEMEVVGFPSRE